MNAITIALAYYENPAMLQEQQLVIAGYPDPVRQATRLIVVDDGSQEHPAQMAAVATPRDYALEVYRIFENRPWGQLGARNLGMHVAPAGSWVLATDIDHVLPAPAAANLLSFCPAPGHYYRPARFMPDGTPTNRHPNSYIMQREWFLEEVGGCNEDFVGWYGTDSVFRERAKLFGACVERHDVWLVVYNRDGIDIGGIGGAATREWGRKKSKYHARSNPEMARRLRGAHLRRPERPLRFRWERVL
jgi:hypothetical protein